MTLNNIVLFRAKNMTPTEFNHYMGDLYNKFKLSPNTKNFTLLCAATEHYRDRAYAKAGGVSLPDTSKRIL